MNKFKFNSRLVVIFCITSVITLLYFFILATASQDLCKENKEECILGLIPIDQTNEIIGSMLGAAYTLTAFYALEKFKLQDTKPEIEIEFLPKFSPQKNEKETKEKYDKEIKKEYIVECKPHQIYVRDNKDKNFIGVGDAIFVRVKVKNTSEFTVEGCRVFLQNIERIRKNKQGDEFKDEIPYNDFLPLLWAYELKGDYFVANSGVTIPSGAYVYADVFVAYNKAITPPITPPKDQESTSTTSANNTDKNSWYLKLKTKIYNTKYDHLIEIPGNDYCKYVFTLKACANQCENKDIKLILEHEKEKKCVSIYKEKSKEKPKFKLPSTEETKAIESNKDTLYKLL